MEQNISQLQTIVAEFARNNKVGRGRAQAFADQIASVIKQSMPKRGRKVSAPVAAFREQLKTNLAETEKFTITDLMKKVNAKYDDVNEAVMRMEKEGTVYRSEVTEQKAGRGRRPFVWVVRKS